MRLRCYLREIRGRRSLRDVAEACGLNRGTLSTIERGHTTPKDEWVEPMEQAYGAPFERWYPPLICRVLELDEDGGE